MEMDMHPDFDAIYFFLMDIAKSGKNGTKIKTGPYERQWKPDGFPPNKEIWDMTSPVKPQN